MNTSPPGTPEPSPTPLDHDALPSWLWALAGLFALVGGWWSIIQTDHPQGVPGALIPPGFVMLTFLGGWLIERTRTRLFTALRWQFVVWGALAFSVLQVAATTWERTTSLTTVAITCVGVLPMLPAVYLVSHTLRRFKRLP
ncbi:hypothetical protein [Nocardiopsis sp. JB363]|uniref:hypothetical protein n=1 Tax=Nocardiopsis sp. JB363 TaxID=1434837 RepID=UPI00097AC1E1|nr:hypothetical protein [Nocardiopsis sp. JB363]SIO86476.1 hypothetical protein BQ8420_12195 [Nocardiopsis sp. JB363]